MPEFPSLPVVSDQPVSVVLLAHQAAGFLDTLLPRWLAELDQLGRPWELFLADAGSTDATVAKAQALGKRVHVLAREGPPAEGLALRAALERCRHPLIFTTRLLPRYQPADLRKLLLDHKGKHPETEAEVPEIDLVHLATGYRAGRPVPPVWANVGVVVRAFQRFVLGMSPTPLPGWLGWRTHRGGWLYRFLFAIRNRDASSPCRLLRRELLPRLALQSEGSFVHVEVLAKATFLGRLLSEDIPIGERKRNLGAEPAAEYVDPPGQWWRDLRRVWRNPDFGPATLAPSSPS